MAHQHFYSRVPARVSLFNKRDGFDTFAHSAGLSREFIVDELSLMYKDKLDIHSPIKLRWGQIPRVYSQAMLPSGRLAQTVISYFPKDFTGERSAYLAHSLILSNEEINTVYCQDGFRSFNPDMFVSDISAFDLTAREVSGNSAMADRAYVPTALPDSRVTLSNYNPDMVKSFIFSLVDSILDEGRDVYFRLPYDDSELSDRALEFINAIMSLLPYSLRQKLSFVTYISDTSSYEGFNLKCVSNDCSQISPEDGVFYDFASGEVTGQSVEYDKFHAYAGFLYSLFEYRKIRDDFHKFVSGIEKKYTDLTFTRSSFTDVIFMFWQCSGFYVEESVIVSNDSLCNFLDVYATFREGIDEHYRVQAYRPLGRYLKEQIAIPDGVYTRLSRLYPTECVAAKAVALDVVLGLLHFDMMRERLFSFISRNYAGEIPAVKEIINANLCRVFYGGFLQTRILRHFDAHFAKEPLTTRDMILDKLLLSIRTPEVQKGIISFIDRHYGGFTSAQKIKLCATCFEMLPECDELSLMLVDLIDRRLSVDAEISKMLTMGIVQSLDGSINAGDWRLTAILISGSGFVESVADSHIFTSSAGVEIFISLLEDMPAHRRVERLVNVRKSVVGMTEEQYAELLSIFVGRPVRIEPSTMYDLISVDKMAASVLSEKSLIALRESIIYPAILHTFNDVFRLDLGKEGIETLSAYIENNPTLANTSQYGVIVNYISMVKLCRGGDTEGAFKIALGMPDDNDVRENIAGHLRTLYGKSASDEAECTHSLLIQYLRDGCFDFDDIYYDYQRRYEEVYTDEGGIRSKIEPSDRRGAADAVELIIRCASDICSVSNELATIVCDERSGLKKALSAFVKDYGLGVGIFFKKCCAEAYFAIGDIADELIEDRNASIGSVEDAVNLILRKK